MNSVDPAAHAPLISLIIPATDAAEFFEALTRIEAGLAGVPHEIIAVYGDDAETLLAADAMPNRPRTLRLVRQNGPSFFATGAQAAGGEVVVEFAAKDPIEIVPRLAALLRAEHSAMAIADMPRGAGILGALDWTLAVAAGMETWNAICGFRAYSAEFLDRQEIAGDTRLATNLELTVKAQMEHAHISALPTERMFGKIKPPESLATLIPWLRAALQAPLIVYGLWLMMTAIALVTAAVSHPSMNLGRVVNVALPSAAAFALTLALRRSRGRVRIADGFFSLVLLNPLFHSHATVPYEPALLAAGLLGLMAGAIIAMKADHLRRYVAVAGLALALSALSDTFIMILPAIVVWLGMVGYGQARSMHTRMRRHGYIVLGAAEACLIIFCLACVLDEPTATPASRTLYSTIVNFTEFPLLVLAIVMLALGWRPVRHRGERKRVPPYFAGMLALLVGLLTMNVNNFSAGELMPPGADQTVILCLVYTVFALHGPRRLQWIVPPLLLVAAVAYTFLHAVK